MHSARLLRVMTKYRSVEQNATVPSATTSFLRDITLLWDQLQAVPPSNQVEGAV